MHKYAIMRTTQDLSSVSTRDLLNECYRRRAIEKFSCARHADDYMATHDGSYVKYLMEQIKRDVWDSVLDNKKFLSDAVVVKHQPDFVNNMQVYTSEVYVCKHPTSLRK